MRYSVFVYVRCTKGPHPVILSAAKNLKLRSIARHPWGR